MTTLPIILSNLCSSLFGHLPYLLCAERSLACMTQQKNEYLFQLLVNVVIEIERRSLTGTYALEICGQTFNPITWQPSSKCIYDGTDVTSQTFANLTASVGSPESCFLSNLLIN